MAIGGILGVIALAATASLQVGGTDELTRVVDRSSERSDGGSSSSHDADTIVARVIATRPDGVEIDYDLPPSATKEERTSTWMFPVRVLRPATGPARLVDRRGVESRIAAWLAAAKLPRAVCGQLVFTWNAFRIECDPETVLKAIAIFDLDASGPLYHDDDARAPVPLVRAADGGSATAQLEVDPERVWRAEAENDVRVGEILRKPVTFEDALAAHAREAISGTIAVNFDVEPDGVPWRRTRVIRTRRVAADGKTETSISTEVITRRRLAR